MRRVSLATIGRLSAFTVLATFGVACGTDSDPGAPPDGPVPARIVSFTVTPTELDGPGTVTLEWETANATSLVATQNGVAIPLEDAPIGAASIAVQVEVDTTFELVASGEVGEPAREERSVTVTERIEAPAIASFVGPDEVEADEFGLATIVLSWEGILRAEEIVLEAEPGTAQSIDLAQAPDGSISVEISTDTTFTLVATNPGGEAREEVQVRLIQLPLIDELELDRLWVGSGEEVTVSWLTTNASHVELWIDGVRSDEVDPTQVDGSFMVAVHFDTTFELRAFNEADTEVSRSVDVAVGRPLVTSFVGTAEKLWLGQSVSFSWESQGANTFIVEADGIEGAICEAATQEDVDKGSCEWQPPVGTYLVSGSAANGSGVVSETWVVEVGTGPQIVAFSMSPEAITLGDELQASWSVLPDPAGEMPTLHLEDDRENTYSLAGAQDGSIRFPMNAGVGEFEFTLVASTTHELSQSVEASVSITVHGVPTGTLTVTPPLFDDAEFDDVALSWTSEHASRLVIYQVFELETGGEELVELLVVPESQLISGELRFVPKEDAAYRMVGTNPLDVAFQAEAELTLVPPEVLSFTADKTSVAVGEPVLLSWTTRMAEEISLSIFGDEYVRGENQEPYVDITEIGGEHLPLTGDCSTNILTTGCARLDFPRGFSFPFDGQNRDEVRVYNNGFLSFEVTHTTSSSTLNSRFPVSPTSNYRYVHLAPFWDALGWDAQKYPSGNIHYLHRIETGGDESLIIQWKDVTLTSGRVASLNFQVILWSDGRFEYRYGDMDPGNGATEAQVGYAISGRSATIGYQTPSQSSADTRQYNTTLEIWGQLTGRSFTYEPRPDLERNGSYLWYPYAERPIQTVSLEVRQGERTHSESLSIEITPRPEIVVTDRPEGPMEIGTTFRLGWSSQSAKAIELIDEKGDRICAAQDQAQVNAGFCEITEAEEGLYTYTFLVDGEMGMDVEKPVTVAYYEPFSIRSFTVDKTIVEEGDSVILSWNTDNAQQVSLLANGVELLPDGAPSGPGSLEITGLKEDTTFLLRLTNSVGMVQEATQSIVTWKVRLTLTPSVEKVRPGEPVTITVSAEDVAGGPTPEFWGSFPMFEVQNPPAYKDISGEPTAVKLATGSPSAFSVPQIEFGDVALPAGFSFPYFGSSYTSARVYNHGIVSFSAPADEEFGSVNNQILPHTATTYRNFHLAPFWDNLRPVGPEAVIWTANPDPNTFIIQWTKFSSTRGGFESSGGVDYEAPYNLNFQVALFRDGTFEYRYGAMDPPAAPRSGCSPSSCVNEANASSATIGYQANRGRLGVTQHFGGTNNDALNPTYPGGIANKVLRFEPVPSGGQMTFNPVRTTTYTLCAMSGAEQVCKDLEIDASFGIESFTVDSDTIGFNETTTLRWTTVGGTRLRIIDSDNQVIVNTTNTAEIDAGSVAVTPPANITYTLELTAPENRATSVTSVDVVRIRLTASGPRSSHPGDPVTISWNMVNSDPSLSPVLVTPMVEVTGPGNSFSDMDISAHPDVKVIESGERVTTTTSDFEFDQDFTFDYLGTPMSRMRVSPAGAISFVASTVNLTAVNTTLPNSATSPSRIQLAPFWDALNTRLHGRVLAARWDADTYVIQWHHMSVTAGSSDDDPYDLNFMVVLRRNGDFEFRYGFMDPPRSSTSGCTPAGCWNEANGSTATIGYQNLNGTVGFELNFSNTASQEKVVAGGLAHRSWRYTRTSAPTGSVEVKPWNTSVYKICALDPETGDATCSNSVDVEVRWGIRDFAANPWAPLVGDPVTLSWDVEGMDSLRILAGSEVVLDVSGAEIAEIGTSTTHVPTTEITTYTLEGVSAGRLVTAEAVVEQRPVSFEFTAESVLRYIPGEELTLNWEVKPLDETAKISFAGPIKEIPAGPEDPGAYRDISANGTKVEMSSTNGYGNLSIPFPFPFLGGTYTTALVYVDGYISFDTSGATGVGANTALPNPGTTQHRIHIAPFWDDLFMRGSDSVWVHSPDADTFIVQWKNFNRSAGSNADNLYDLNFQVVFYSNGSFEYRYGAMKPFPPPHTVSSCYPNTCELEANGSSATIGYQSTDGQFGYQMHFGGNGSANVVPFEGGLENRSFRFDPDLSGSMKVRAATTKDFSMCMVAELGSGRRFEECKTVTVQPVANPGDLMFTELMLDPGVGSTEQWFEVRNLTKEPIDLDGFVLRSSRGSHAITGPLVVDSGAFAVFAVSTIPDFTPDRVYGADLDLHREVDTLELHVGTSLIASASWDASWTIPTGRSLSLDARHHMVGTMSNPADNWCDLREEAPTPGTLGFGCQSPYYDVDVMGVGTYYDLSSMGTALREFETNNTYVGLRIPGFSMPVFDDVVRTVWVAANGWVSFSEDGPTSGSTGYPTSLPRTGTGQPPGPLFAGFWTLLRCDRNVHDCVFRYHHGEFDGKRALILDWSGFRYSTTVGGLTFQIQLWEDGDIKVVFGDIWTTTAPGATGHNNYHGNSAAMFIEGPERSEITIGHHRAVVDLPHRVFHFRRR